MERTKIRVSTTINGEVSKVWDYWTKPEHIVNWNFASNDWHCPAAENDPRTGGKFKYTMASKDGEMSFDFEGVYDEVIHEKKIAYSMADGRLVTVVFKKEIRKTKVTETFDAEDIHSEEMQRTGWQAILDNFKHYTETT
ncbi:SRPBCC domain-containing protein [Flavobacteriaceae bacterium KMM 6898]|nr:SRPBCC domain-containing protein [Flavobacteriaceae bacterium KMM 6898]